MQTLVRNPGPVLGAAVIWALLSAAVPCQADSFTAYSDDEVATGQTVSGYWPMRNTRAYLRQARRFRSEGRYELARQSYLQALSICPDPKTVHVLQRELDGVELLLRTMR